MYNPEHDNVLALIDLMLTLPASSAEVERGFSQMKLLKSDVRSRLTQERLNDLMTIKMLSPGIKDFTPTEAINAWNTSGTRPRRPLLRDRSSSRSKSTGPVTVLTPTPAPDQAEDVDEDSESDLDELWSFWSCSESESDNSD